MAATESTMLELGTPCPDFDLPNTNAAVHAGRVTRDAAMGEHGLLVMFICNHCPFVIHVASELANIGRHCHALGVGCVAICSNDVNTHPGDSPGKMTAEAANRGYTFPYCHDESQDVARAFSASCTPDFFLFDRKGKLTYRGQLDDSRPGNDAPVTGADLRAAIDATANDKPCAPEQWPSIGCNIKWKP
ncbi:MAG: thioredoxin family protein [Phycisphaeraceae bacterium]|nr:thioredoxin family protein [Phycisphaeraceae bacterium]